MAQPVTWPGGARCAIMMTFDLDGESPWIQRDPALAERPLHMSMGSYGPKTGMPRILDVLDRYGIKTCIFTPGWIVERYPSLREPPATGAGNRYVRSCARLCADVPLRERLGAAGPGRLDQGFRPAQMVAAYAGLYERLLAPASRC